MQPIQKIDPVQMRNIFLNALDYPENARPEFYMKHQPESGWSKGVFLRELEEAYHYYKSMYNIKRSHEIAMLEKEDKKLSDEFTLKVEEDGKPIRKVTKRDLKDLFLAIEYAYKLDKKIPDYNSFEIVDFCERILLFVKGQFESQIKKNSSAQFVAKKLGFESEGTPEYLLYHYSIISDAPIANYKIFRRAIRKLLLDSQNPSELKVILKPLVDISIKIVDIWNNDLHKIEMPEEGKGKAVRDQMLITFDDKTSQIWIRNTDDKEDFYKEPSEHFWNSDFAVFASNVANLISAEVLKEGISKKDIVEEISFVDTVRIEELKKVKHPKFDLAKIIQLCEELNSSYLNKNYFSVSFAIRSIIDHIPPIFGMQSFTTVANNYSGGTKSFKKSMENLEKSLRNIADNNIHSQIRESEVLPTFTQVDFRQDFDVLLAEMIRLLKKQ